MLVLKVHLDLMNLRIFLAVLDGKILFENRVLASKGLNFYSERLNGIPRL